MRISLWEVIKIWFYWNQDTLTNKGIWKIFHFLHIHKWHDHGYGMQKCAVCPKRRYLTARKVNEWR